MKNRLQYVHPILVATAPAVFLWSNNFAEVFPWEVFFTGIALVLFAGAVIGISWLFLRDTRKAGIVASTFLLLSLSYQHIFFNSLTGQFMRHRWSFLLVVLVVVATWYAVRRTKNDMHSATILVSAISGAFVALSLLQLAGGYFVASTEKPESMISPVSADEPQETRDIYYLILDEYAAPDVLRDVLDSTGADVMTSALEQKGFFVAHDARSNYPGTHLSLPSALNLQYVEDEYLEDGAKPLKALTAMMEDHFLKDFLKARGYRYIHVGADWTTFYNRYADENINLGLFSPFQMVLWRSTIFSPIEMAMQGRSPLGKTLGFLNLDFLDFRLTQWKRIQYQLEEIGKVPDREGPVFVFAHLLIPHEPYVFDEEGNFVTAEEEAARSTKENYLRQVAYLDSAIQKLIDDVLEKSDPKPIVIIQGDQGHKFPIYDPIVLKEQYGLEPSQVPELLVRILNAYYLPDGGSTLLYESITPVNSFRLVLNHYFGQEFDLLKDKSYTFNPDDSTKLMLLQEPQ